MARRARAPFFIEHRGDKSYIARGQGAASCLCDAQSASRTHGFVGDAVGASAFVSRRFGFSPSAAVGATVATLGASVGHAVMSLYVGLGDGMSDGGIVGRCVGRGVGASDGGYVGKSVGSCVGLCVGGLDGRGVGF